MREYIRCILEASAPSIFELHVFDFDATFFKSPHEPEGIGEDDWWSSPESLEPPCVPETPGPEWYNQEPVQAMRAAKANPQAYVVIMTGRTEALRAQVMRIVKASGVEPDEYILNPGMDTGQYKAAETKYLLKNFPRVRVVHFWEDRVGQLKFYERQVRSMGIDFVPHVIAEPDMPCAVESV